MTTTNTLRQTIRPRPTFGGIVRAELTKALRSRSLVLMAWFGTLLSAVTSYGYGELGADGDPARLTDDVVRAWMMMFLFSAVFAALYIGREFDSRVITRSVLLAGTRSRVLQAKSIVALTTGLGFGLLSALGGVVSAMVIPNIVGTSSTWSPDATATTAGLVACGVLASAWGAALALVLRSQIVGTLAVIAFTLLIDPGLQRIWPEAANGLFTIALSSLYRDPKPLLLDPWLAALVAIAWIGILAVVGRAVFLRKDLP